MPASAEMPPTWRSRSVVSEEWRKRAVIVTSEVNPGAVQPVQAGGIQSCPNSARLQDLTIAGSSMPGQAGIASLPQGDWGPDPTAAGQTQSVNTNTASPTLGEGRICIRCKRR